MPDSPAERFEKRCHAKGIKLTGQRRAIIGTFAESPGHPTAVDLHDRLVRRHPRISLSTVYRTLRLLCDAGLVEEHEFGEGRHHYELSSRTHHDHLIDTESGKIIEFCDPEIERLQQVLADRLGYRLVHHRLELYAVRRN